MRLIDADELLTDPYFMDETIPERVMFIEAVEDSMTIDAVPAVRKPVVGYEGYYEVDQFGRVFSLNRSVVVVDGNRSYTKHLNHYALERNCVWPSEERLRKRTDEGARLP